MKAKKKSSLLRYSIGAASVFAVAVMLLVVLRVAAANVPLNVSGLAVTYNSNASVDNQSLSSSGFTATITGTGTGCNTGTTNDTFTFTNSTGSTASIYFNYSITFPSSRPNDNNDRGSVVVNGTTYSSNNSGSVNTTLAPNASVTIKMESDSGSSYTTKVTVSNLKFGFTVTWKNGNETLETDNYVPYQSTPSYDGTEPTQAETDAYTYTFDGWDPAVSEETKVTGDVTYNAKFKENKRSYPITWQNEDGSEIETTEVEYGTVPTHADATKTSTTDGVRYVFDGWDPEVVSVTGAATYKATFKTQYQITWDKANGTDNETEWVDEGKVPTHADPTKAADAQYTYNFKEWTPAPVAATAPATYTATYDTTTNKYPITWQNEDGSEIETTEVEYDTVPTHADATKTSTTDGVRYVFTGWDPTPTAVTGAATYKATFKTQYQITWDKADGTQTPTETEWVDAGTVPTHADPTKAADAQYTYNFKEWTPAPVAATAPATYTATYDTTTNKYPITWQNEDGSEIDTTEVEYGTVPTHAAATKTSTTDGVQYVFTGWDPEVVSVTGAATYKATFKTQYQITWDKANGSANETEWVDAGTVPAYSGTDPEKAADAQYTYNFKEWSPAPVAAAAPATYTATYNTTTNKYNITWQNDDGSEIDTTEVEYGTVPTHADATKESTAQYTYEFAGWDPEVVAVTGEATYKATFTPNLRSYTITWQNDDGSVIDTTTVEYGETPTHADAVKTNGEPDYNYTFTGWDPAIQPVTGEATYKATYTAEKKPFIKRKSLTLDGNIIVNFYIDPSAAGLTPEMVKAEPKTLTVTIDWADYRPLSKIAKTVTITVNGTNFKEIGDLIPVSCEVCAAEMSCDIKVDVELNGESDGITYSVRDYGKTVLDPTSKFSVKYVEDNGAEAYAKLRNLVIAMLDYGAKAQKVFGVNIGNWANDLSSYDMTFDYTMQNVDDTMFETAIKKANGGENDGRVGDDISAVAGRHGAKWYTTSVYFLQFNKIRHVFTKANDTFNPSDYPFNQKNFYYYVESAEGIPAAELDKLQDFTVGNETFKYSVLDYARALAKSQNDAQKELAMSVYWYNQAANAYFPAS